MLFILLQSVRQAKKDIRDYIYYRAYKIFFVNTTIYGEFIRSFVKADVILHKKVIKCNSVLLFFVILEFICLLYVFVHENIRIYWLFVVLLVVASFSDFVCAFMKIDLLDVVTTLIINKFTDDNNIINAYKRRCDVKAVNLGNFLRSYFLILKFSCFDALNISGFQKRKNKGFLTLDDEFVNECIY